MPLVGKINDKKYHIEVMKLFSIEGVRVRVNTVNFIIIDFLYRWDDWIEEYAFDIEGKLRMIWRLLSVVWVS